MGQGKHSWHQAPRAAPSSAPGTNPPFLDSRPLRLGLLLVLVAGGLGLSLWLGRPSAPREKEPAAPPPQEAKEPEPQDDFLASFQKTEAEPGDAGSAATNAELEKQYQEVAPVLEQLAELRVRIASRKALTHEKMAAAVRERDRLVQELNVSLPRLQRALTTARKARPRDPVPAWLTGELLMRIGGEPALVLPYLEKAVAGKLDRARLFATLAHVYHAGNQFQKAHEAALHAVERDPRSEESWHAYYTAAFTLERFAELLERLDRTFPKNAPEWAKNLREGTLAAQKRLQKEQKLRRADARANDLPRVRLTIEHRRFAHGPDGKPLAKIESTGKGEVIVELFEDQAPASVANFLHLVEQGFYNGTRFHLARPAGEVVGGDPKTKQNDPSQDGSGGPGYTIPDEYDLPHARLHFRGSLGMANAGQPGTAGSQFYLTSAATPELDGQYTVFGRVIGGQEVVDRITLGRTNRKVGQGGKIVPGDLLVRAEVLRKRPHEYRVQKRPAR